MQPSCFASRHLHRKLYAAYDRHPEIWKPALAGYYDSRYFDETQEDTATGSALWSLDYYQETTAKALSRIINCSIPFDMESMDYWCEKRISNAIRYTKAGACQWMSKANYYLATKYLPNHSWFHVSDDDMQGHSHYYVMNDAGEILDPQGIALDFPLVEYQKTFSPHKVTPHYQVLSDLSWWDFEYQSRQLPLQEREAPHVITLMTDYLKGMPSELEPLYA